MDHQSKRHRAFPVNAASMPPMKVKMLVFRAHQVHSLTLKEQSLANCAILVSIPLKLKPSLVPFVNYANQERSLVLMDQHHACNAQATHLPMLPDRFNVPNAHQIPFHPLVQRILLLANLAKQDCTILQNCHSVLDAQLAHIQQPLVQKATALAYRALLVLLTVKWENPVVNHVHLVATPKLLVPHNASRVVLVKQATRVPVNVQFAKLATMLTVQKVVCLVFKVHFPILMPLPCVMIVPLVSSPKLVPLPAPNARPDSFPIHKQLQTVCHAQQIPLIAQMAVLHARNVT